MSYSALALAASVLPSISLAKAKVKFIPLAKDFSQRIQPDDKCGVCGTKIKHYPGPKCEAYFDDNEGIVKYCSPKDMFTQIHDHKHDVRAAYVHDIGSTSWDDPQDEYFIDATSAYYVEGSSKIGAQGSNLVSFADKTEAEAFSVKFGGVIVKFDNIKEGLL